MTKKEFKKAVEEAVRTHLLGKEVEYNESGCFSVRSFIVKGRSRYIPRFDFSDYGVDQDCVYMALVELYDAPEERDALDACCFLLTLNNDGKVGTASVPYHFPLEGANNLSEFIAEKMEGGGDEGNAL